jgi:hypothetical protein
MGGVSPIRVNKDNVIACHGCLWFQSEQPYFSLGELRKVY